MPRSFAYCLCLPVGRSKCTPVSNQTKGNLLEHFQQHALAGQLGKKLWQAHVRPPLDTNVGILTRPEFNLDGWGSQLRRRLTRNACVSVVKAPFALPITRLSNFGSGNALSGSEDKRRSMKLLTADRVTLGFIGLGN